MGVYTYNNHSNKAMSILSYTVKVSKYSTTFISDHLDKMTTFVLQQFIVELWCFNAATQYANPNFY